MEKITECKTHGQATHVRRKDGWRCRRCESEKVSRTRRQHRHLLVQEAGGRCALCGYNRCLAALQFHHRDPATKAFGLSGKGQTYSLERKRAEVAKCILLCANCHAEVEVGLHAPLV